MFSPDDWTYEHIFIRYSYEHMNIWAYEHMSNSSFTTNGCCFTTNGCFTTDNLGCNPLLYTTRLRSSKSSCLDQFQKTPAWPNHPPEVKFYERKISQVPVWGSSLSGNSVLHRCIYPCGGDCTVIPNARYCNYKCICWKCETRLHNSYCCNLTHHNLDCPEDNLGQSCPDFKPIQVQMSGLNK